MVLSLDRDLIPAGSRLEKFQSRIPGLKKWVRDWNPYMCIVLRDPVHANPESRDWEIGPGLQSLVTIPVADSGIIRPIIVLSEALPHTNALTSEHT
jgi:hypothetical protein